MLSRALSLFLHFQLAFARRGLRLRDPQALCRQSSWELLRSLPSVFESKSELLNYSLGTFHLLIVPVQSVSIPPQSSALLNSPFSAIPFGRITPYINPLVQGIIAGLYELGFPRYRLKLLRNFSTILRKVDNNAALNGELPD